MNKNDSTGFGIRSNVLLGLAHEIWATAQLLPGEGIEDGVERIVALLNPTNNRRIRQRRQEVSKCKCPKLDCWDELCQLTKAVARLQRKVCALEKAVIQLQTVKEIRPKPFEG